MKLIHPSLDTQFEIAPGVSWELAIEARGLYVRLVRELACQLRGGMGDWVFSTGSKPKNLAQCVELIIDPFSLDPAKNKPLIKRMVDRMSNTAQLAENIENSLEVLTVVQKFAYRLIDESGFSFEAGFPDDYSIGNFVGALGVAPVFDGETLIDNLIDYWRILHELRGVPLFIVVGLRTWLSDHEMAEVVRNCVQDGFALMTIEHYDGGPIHGMRRCLIDDSLSEM